MNHIVLKEWVGFSDGKRKDCVSLQLQFNFHAAEGGKKWQIAFLYVLYLNFYLFIYLAGITGKLMFPHKWLG